MGGRGGWNESGRKMEKEREKEGKKGRGKTMRTRRRTKRRCEFEHSASVQADTTL